MPAPLHTLIWGVSPVWCCAGSLGKCVRPRGFFVSTLWVSICAAGIGLWVATLDGMVFGGRSWEAFRSTLLPNVLVHIGAVQALLVFWWAAGEARLLQAQLASSAVGTALFSAVLRSQLTWISRTVLTTPVGLLGR